jgi:hypothetical protein
MEQLIVDPTHVQQIIQRDVPMLASDWGVKDEDALIHTLGINLLGSLGRAAGYVSLIEYPVPRAQRWQNKLVRVDAAWIDRHTRQPAVLVEFERFSMDTVLAKQTNLYVAAHGCAVPPAALLLCVWALDGVPVNTSWYEVDNPLPVPGGPSVTRPASSYMVLVQAVFGCRGERLHFLRFRRLM